MITVTICMVTLIAFAGLAVDVGYLEFVKRGMQTAADSAAIAGAQELLRGDSSEIQPAALHDAGLDGFADGANNISIAVNNPPLAGYYAGDSSAVEVIIQQPNQPMTFMHILGVAPATVAARAVAHLGAGDGCLVALDPSGRGSITFDGTASVTLNNCTVIDNSNNCSAMVANGAAYVQAAGFDVVGSCPGYTGDSTNYSTTPSTGLLPSPDPLASLPAPPIGTCQTFNSSQSTIYPGTYCGGITITGGTYTFLPGTYIINGGGLTITGGTVTGDGVFFYLTGTLSGAPSTRYGPVSISGNAAVTFSGPSSGTYADVLFYQDRTLDLTAKPSLASSITGTSASTFNGILYFPTSTLNFTGTSGAAASNTQIIAWDMKIAGTPNFSGDFSAMPGGAKVKMVVLGE